MSNSAYDLADEILSLDLTKEDIRDELACRIKKYGHGEKFSVYHRIFLDIKYSPRSLRKFKKHVKNFVSKKYIEEKIKIHEEFKTRPFRNQIWGIFDWKK